MVGDRISSHIRASSKESKRGMQKRIFEIYIFEFRKDSSSKFDKRICGIWAKKEYPPLYSKDGFAYDGKDTLEYMHESNSKVLTGMIETKRAKGFKMSWLKPG